VDIGLQLKVENLLARYVHALDDDRLEERLQQIGAVGVYRKYELIQPQRADEAARVRKVLTPVLGAAPALPAQRAVPRVRSA